MEGVKGIKFWIQKPLLKTIEELPALSVIVSTISPPPGVGVGLWVEPEFNFQ